VRDRLVICETFLTSWTDGYGEPYQHSDPSGDGYGDRGDGNGDGSGAGESGSSNGLVMEESEKCGAVGY
jgi:hypothetical protein